MQIQEEFRIESKREVAKEIAVLRLYSTVFGYVLRITFYTTAIVDLRFQGDAMYLSPCFYSRSLESELTFPKSQMTNSSVSWVESF